MKATRILWFVGGAIGSEFGCATLIGLESADPPPACINDADEAALVQHRATFVADVVGCAVANSGNLGTTSACIQTKDGLSKPCADCSAANGACDLKYCGTECGSGAGSVQCQACVAAKCNAALVECAGTPVYACVDTTDKAALMQHMSSLDADVKRCGLMHSTDLDAVATCIVNTDGLTPPCALCHAMAASCAITKCPTCVDDPTSASCSECATSACSPAFALCSGISPLDGDGGTGSDSGPAPDGGGTRSDSGPAPDGGGDTGSDSGPAPTRPCDLYEAGGTPCVAAFSTVRALYGSYSRDLYQVRRADNTTLDIGVLNRGGVANAAAQDAFCSGTTCTISVIYDQSGMGNHLTRAPGGSATYGPNPDVEAVADALPITIGGHKAYGVHVTPAPSWTSQGQVGYRNTNTHGIAKGDEAETEYMVTDGTYFNGACCFDFGNTEMEPGTGGPGAGEAIYFGTCGWWDKGQGDGPWVMADFDNGLYTQGGPSGSTNADNMSLAYPFVTAMLKGNTAQGLGGGPFTIKGANAQSGTLTTAYDGSRPDGYSPMGKQGGIILGVGGNNASTAQGNFYEGVMTKGYASSATDDAVQANIIAAGYGK